MCLQPSQLPSTSRKRKLADFEEHDTHVHRHHTPILDWLFDTTRYRSSSAPPFHRSIMVQGQMDPPPPLPPLPLLPTATPSFSDYSRITTDSTKYPDILSANGVSMDRRGKSIPEGIARFLGQHILKSREDTLTAQQLDEVEHAALEASNDSEFFVSKILQTPMFPIKRRGISSGGTTTLFSREPLPRDPALTRHEISTPKPDVHVGFFLGDFDRFQRAVLVHDHASPYTKTGNTVFSFLAVEAKAEARKGNIWHAENQAAGGGAHCVNSLRWLYSEAGSQANVEQTLAFSVCLTTKLACLYVHYYSDEQIWMSSVRVYVTERPHEVQECNWHVANILDFAMDTRKAEIEGLLAKLHPFPETWPGPRPSKRQKRANSAANTPSASFSSMHSIE